MNLQAHHLKRIPPALKDLTMYKLYYRESVNHYKTRDTFFVIFARFMLALLTFLLLIGFCAEAAASEGEPATFNPEGLIIFGIVAAAAFYLKSSSLPCDPLYDVGQPSDFGVQPSKPWRDHAPLAEILSEPNERLADPLPTKDILYPNYRTRACDKPGFVERRKHDRVPTTDAHRDDHAILMLSFSMKQRLANMRQMKENLDHHNHAAVSLEELEQALLVAMRRGDLIDIANHVMFLHERGVKAITSGVRK